MEEKWIWTSQEDKAKHCEETMIIFVGKINNWEINLQWVLPPTIRRWFTTKNIWKFWKKKEANYCLVQQWQKSRLKTYWLKWEEQKDDDFYAYHDSPFLSLSYSICCLCSLYKQFLYPILDDVSALFCPLACLEEFLGRVDIKVSSLYLY